jgi:hypothetical protein
VSVEASGEVPAGVEGGDKTGKDEDGQLEAKEAVLPKAKGRAKAKAKAGAAKAKAKAGVVKATGKAKAKAGAGKRAFVRDDDPSGDPLPPSSDFPDRDAFHEMVVQDVLKCLRTCEGAGTLNVKGRHAHAHDHDEFEMRDGLAWNIYWSRKCASVKKGKQQVNYFSRSTPCCGTNIVLARHWV